VPYPTVLADTQVLFNGQPAPLLLVSPGQINFMIPMSAPTSGTADVQVVRQSTGQILTDGLVAMNTVSPAVFAGGLSNCSLAGGKCKQAAVVNDATGQSTVPPTRRRLVRTFPSTPLGRALCRALRRTGTFREGGW
jgi:uncharacterized protein (TIGR03437 family)